MTAPERIWAFSADDIAENEGGATIVAHESYQPYATEYVRADLHDATKAKLRKAVGALRNIAVVGFSSDPSVNGAIAKQTVLQARTVLAEIEKGGV